MMVFMNASQKISSEGRKEYVSLALGLSCPQPLCTWKDHRHFLSTPFSLQGFFSFQVIYQISCHYSICMTRSIGIWLTSSHLSLPQEHLPIFPLLKGCLGLPHHIKGSSPCLSTGANQMRHCWSFSWLLLVYPESFLSPILTCYRQMLVKDYLVA